MLAVRNITRKTLLGDRISVADGSLARLVGLLGRKSLEPGTGLLIVPSQAVHTLGMRFPIDVLFMDRTCRVVGLRPRLAPFRLSRLYWKAWAVLELPAGTAALSNTAFGDQLSVEEVP